MITSALMTPDEKRYFENLVSYNSRVKVSCVARLYKAAYQSWVLISSGVVTLEELFVLNVVSICFYGKKEGRKLIKTDLYKEMKYQQCTPQFHLFHGVVCPLGLAFACPKEANDLFAFVQTKINPPSAQNGRFAALMYKAKRGIHGVAERVAGRLRNEDQTNIKFDQSGFKHIEHVGMDSNGKGLRIKAQTKELAKELLEVLGVKAQSEIEMAAVINLIENCGVTEVQEALEIHNYTELEKSTRSTPAVTSPPAPPPPPLPSQQPANDDRGKLLNSIEGFDVTKLRQVKRTDEPESLPNKGPIAMASIQTALAQMLNDRRKYLGGCDSDEDA
ncbi:wiskott Aldrich syndrome protein [Echinococcus multilocularis]|uniref:Wiskott Aldrich syndrome protein n=1 Tax=Echinococcus multilocularis TaxID=6211 RepID=A0A068Y7U1_ECHMU|nr:wiskott Aldrich syndrome protein [Echinococcus multilocularis]